MQSGAMSSKLRAW